MAVRTVEPLSPVVPLPGRRLVALMTGAVLAVAAAALALPSVGPGRHLLAALLLLGVAPSQVVLSRRLDDVSVLVGLGLLDIGWVIGLIQLVPDLLACGALLLMGLIALLSFEMEEHLEIVSLVATVALAATGWVHGVASWPPIVVIFAIVQPVLIHLSRLHRLRERAARIEIRRRADSDPLTGLLNRRALARLLAGPQAGRAVLVCDLDGFKDVNDTLGHTAGDELLVALATRIAEEVGDDGVVARFGGDEFAVLVDADVAHDVARRLVAACRHRVPLGDLDVSVGVSIGGAIPRLIGDGLKVDGEELLRRADLAMFEAKRNGGGVRIWSDQMERITLDRVRLTGEVDRAFDDGELDLWFQPIVDIRSGAIVGVEGLIRWHHPDHGVLGPDQFLAMMEAVGRRTEVDAVVFDAGAAMAARLCEWGTTVSLNVSAGSLMRRTLPHELLGALERHGVPPARVVLEVVEDELVGDQAVTREVVERLGRLGIALAIDDFGTGHSSLARLRRLPVAALKIDRSFVIGFTANEDDDAIIAAIGQLGRALDLIVVAEGVDDLSLVSPLAARGIDRVQGFGVSTPLPPDDLVAWMEEHDGRVDLSEGVVLRRP